MSRLVLHIGTHKTATTTIQDTFAANADLLAQHGLIYPQLGPATGHHGLAMDWNHLPPSYALPGGALAALRRISADHGAGDATVLLSSEEFSRGDPQNRVDFTALRAALSGFDRIEVVCLLRAQAQFLQSIYLEVSKYRAPPRPPAVLEAALSFDMVEGLWTDYTRLYDHLLQGFAPDEITFLDYEACRQAPGGVLGAMLTHLGVPLDPADLVAVNGGRSNPSPMALPAWAANLIAEPQVAPPWLIETTTAAFFAQFGPKARSCLWSRAELERLNTYAETCNTRLGARLAAAQPGFALMNPPMPSGMVHREDLRADFWLRANRRMFAATAPVSARAKAGPTA